ncbi:MAG: hypothetical protein QM737_00955 [Ferruginibacter sp.]
MDKIKLGILDLLSILLPGAFLVGTLYYYCYKHGITDAPHLFLNKFTSEPNGWVSSVIFLILSYIAGQFVFTFASLLDDLIYENVKKVFWEKDSGLQAQAIALKTKKTGINDQNTINAFKWSCSWLLLKKPEMYEEVERYIAESKFFRSLFIVWLITAILIGRCLQLNAFLLLILGIILSLIRYLTQRRKSITTAYEYVITASEEIFPSRPNPITLYEITKRNKEFKLILAKNEKRKVVLLIERGVHFTTKIINVIDLCLNPFYLKPRKIKPATICSKEIRWFFEEKKSKIEQWFLDNKLKSVDSKSRIDLYLQDTALEENFKQREGKLEIKTRIPYPILTQINNNIWCYQEEWIKNIHDPDKIKDLLPREFSNKEPQWLPVQKERLLVKTKQGIDKKLTPLKKEEMLTSGCQLEYTTINVLNQEWYSFAAEWFGDIDDKQVYDLIIEITKDTVLESRDSFSYPTFINKVINKKTS